MPRARPILAPPPANRLPRHNDAGVLPLQERSTGLLVLADIFAGRDAVLEAAVAMALEAAAAAAG